MHGIYGIHELHELHEPRADLYSVDSGLLRCKRGVLVYVPDDPVDVLVLRRPTLSDQHRIRAELQSYAGATKPKMQYILALLTRKCRNVPP